MSTTTTTPTMEQAVTATLVSDDKRMAFLPNFFGKAMLRGEGYLFDWARRICPQYHGGYWDFYTLSNGGFFAAPSMGDQPVKVSISTNGYEGSMSAQAAGVVITLFALSYLIAELYGEENNEDLVEKLNEHYHQLRDFVSELDDSRQIFSAID